MKKTLRDGAQETVSLSGSPAISVATLTLASAALETDANVKVSFTDEGVFRIQLQLLSNLGNLPDYGQCTRPWHHFHFSAEWEDVIVNGNMVAPAQVRHGYG